MSKNKDRKMKIERIIFFMAVAISLFSCGSKTETSDNINISTGEGYVAKGDSTIYGLACDGCTDSVLVFLPQSGSDPVTYNIINAMKVHQVFGRPQVGDDVALILDPRNKKTAKMVIDLNDMAGTWTYKVMPTLRMMGPGAPAKGKNAPPPMPDSIMKTLMVPRDYGFTLNDGYTAKAVGAKMKSNSLDDDSPVTYPEIKHYSEWHIFNGKLILTINALKIPGNKTQRKMSNDTAQIMLLMRDSLVLKFKNGIQGYHRQGETKDRN